MYNNQQPASYESIVDVCVASAMHMCRGMTDQELNDLLYDDAKIDSIIDNLPQVRSLPTERESGLAQNKSLAEWNLQQEPRVEQLKQSLREGYSRALALKGECDAVKTQLDSLSSTRSLDTTSSLLQVAAQEADDDAEELASRFTRGDVPADLFLKEFMDKKTLAHTRKLKSDRLMSLLREQQYAPQQASRAGGGGGGGGGMGGGAYSGYPQVAMSGGSAPYPPSGGAPYPDMNAVNRHSMW